ISRHLPVAKKGRARRPGLACKARLETDVSRQLQDSRIVCADRLSQPAAGKVPAQRAELGVVEEIESVQAELELHPFAEEWSLLRQCQVHVGASWTAQQVPGRRSITGSGSRKRVGIVEEESGVAVDGLLLVRIEIADRADQVRIYDACIARARRTGIAVQRIQSCIHAQWEA